MLTNDSKIRYNESTDMVQVYHNSNWQDWKRAYADIDPTKMELTQEEFIAICENNLQAHMSIGAIVYLNNNYCNAYEVIDVNHDSTIDTVDLMAHTQVYNMAITSRNWSANNARTWLNETYKGSFDLPIINRMKAMTITDVSNGNITTDYVKLLSYVELGMENTNAYFIADGTGQRYPVFNADPYNVPDIARWREAGTSGSATRYATRSYPRSATYRLVFVNQNGAVSEADYTQSFGLLPVLRF